jgi:TetR/AcrR family acrAB operon transcriptional repressor
MRKTKIEAEKTRADIITAARRVFHQHGVSRSTLERIAQDAGVTRGAVYWHFQNKAELFSAMREDIFRPLIAQMDETLLSDIFDDPLDAIEASLKEFFRALTTKPVVREVFEIMISRCEYVDEFVSVREEICRPGQDFLAKLERVYQLAAGKGTLRSGLDPQMMARDSSAFATGILHQLFGYQDSALQAQIPEMIAGHMKLRRR